MYEVRVRTYGGAISTIEKVGTTVGSIRFDDENVIQSVVIDSDPVVGHYTKDVNMRLQKYVGQKMIFY